MITLYYLPFKNSRLWRKSSLTMHPAGINNMQKDAESLARQNGWHKWEIRQGDICLRKGEYLK